MSIANRLDYEGQRSIYYFGEINGNQPRTLDRVESERREGRACEGQGKAEIW